MPAAMEIDRDDGEGQDASPGVNGKVLRKKGASADDNREAFSPELLRLYYARLFPYDQVLVFGCTTVVRVCHDLIMVFALLSIMAIVLGRANLPASSRGDAHVDVPLSLVRTTRLHETP